MQRSEFDFDVITGPADSRPVRRPVPEGAVADRGDGSAPLPQPVDQATEQ